MMPSKTPKLGAMAVAVVLIASGLAFFIGFYLLPGTESQASAVAIDTVEVPVGGTIREAPLQGLNGPSRNLGSFAGRPLIINVWASWCGPCRQEMASLERLAWLIDSPRFAIIGISTDDDAQKAQGFLAEAHATISQFIDRGLIMENMLGAKRLPLTVLIGADGRILQKIYGAREWDSQDALSLIDKAFKETKRSQKTP